MATLNRATAVDFANKQVEDHIEKSVRPILSAMADQSRIISEANKAIGKLQGELQQVLKAGDELRANLDAAISGGSVAND